MAGSDINDTVGRIRDLLLSQSRAGRLRSLLGTTQPQQPQGMFGPPVEPITDSWMVPDGRGGLVRDETNPRYLAWKAQQDIYAAQRRKELEAAAANNFAKRKLEFDKMGVEYRDPNKKDIFNSLTGGAGGFYHPITNSTVVYAGSENDDRNTLYHELEHKRQYAQPGDLRSKIAIQMAQSIAEKLSMGHPDIYRGTGSRAPLEALAILVGEGAENRQWPPPGWGKLSNEEKLWVEKNYNGAMTDQNYLANPSPTKQRLKNIAADVPTMFGDLGYALKSMVGGDK
jgi:hypothetical protein